MPESLKSEVRDFWDKNPMRYITAKTLGTKEFFDDIDDYFYEAHSFGHDTKPIFSKLIDYSELKGRKVLEIGCGMGTMLEQFASHGADVAGIDLTPTAVEMTKKRFELRGLMGTIQEGDAENLEFPDASFDFVFSWGVIHHTPDTQKAVEEIYRVLRPGGKASVMIYHKNSIFYYYHVLFKKGVLMLEFLKHSKQKILNRYTDAADVGGTPLSKVYSKSEARELFGDFQDVQFRVFGMAGEAENIPFGRFPVAKWVVPKAIREKISRRYGWFLYITAKK